MSASRIFIGSLPSNVDRNELEDAFKRYGAIRELSLKTGFAHIEYESVASAEDAAKAMNCADFQGARLRVEFARARGGVPARGGAGAGEARPRSNFRVIVSGLPSGVIWQDLKDFGRAVGNVLYSAVGPDRSNPSGPLFGVLEFERESEMTDAVSRLNGSTLSYGPDNRTAVVNVEQETQERSFAELTGGMRVPNPPRPGGPSRGYGGGGYDDRRGGYGGDRGGYDDRRGGYDRGYDDRRGGYGGDRGGYDDRRGGYDDRRGGGYDDRDRDRDRSRGGYGGGDRGYDRDRDYDRGHSDRGRGYDRERGYDNHHGRDARPRSRSR